MIKIERTETYGWEAAIRGMRNPKNSWDKSDTAFYCYPQEGVAHKIGDNDMKLMRTLANAGPVHGKYLRMITVTCDITAPLYWWKEMDTYKVGTVADSCSTMHKLASRPLTPDDFSHEHLLDSAGLHGGPLSVLKGTIAEINYWREMFVKSKDKEAWWQMIQLLPSSYNQRRTWQASYAVLKNIYEYRKDHKLDEWHTFCDWIDGLPYSELITGEAKDR